jgi:HlyD family secretion protein
MPSPKGEEAGTDRRSLRGAAPGQRKKARARRRLRARVVMAAAAGLLIAVGVAAAWPKPIQVEEATVRNAPLEVTVDEPGKTRVRERYVVHAPLAGDLGRIELHAGDPVAVGAPIAQIIPSSPALLDPRTRAEAGARVGAAEANFAQARAQMTRAEAASTHAAQDLETTKHLTATGAVSPDEQRNAELEARLRQQELDAGRFAVQAARNDVDVARAALGRYGGRPGGLEPFTIASPVSGRVLRVDQQSESVVAPGTPLVEVGDPRSLEVVADVLTADAVRIPANAPVRLERWGGPAALQAHVRVVEPSAFTKVSALGVEEQRTSVVIDIDDPSDLWARLGDGYRVEAHIVIWHADGVMTIPASAAFRQGSDWAVFAEEHGRAHLRIVQLGQRGAEDIQVLSGLSTGDRVVVHPSSGVVDGVRIAGQ